MKEEKDIPVLGWDEKHPKAKIFSKLWDTLVPTSGEAETIEGELIRCAGRLVYEYCNNGNCNAVDYIPTSQFDPWDDNEEEKVLSEMYAGFITYIRQHVPNLNNECDALVELIRGPYNYNYKYSNSESEIYNAVTEPVLDFVIKRLV